MTRRERHERIVRWFEHTKTREFAEARMLSNLGLSAFTDAALETLARRCWSDYRHHMKLARQNRERFKHG